MVLMKMFLHNKDTKLTECENIHSVKSVRIRRYSVPHFLAFALNTERYEVSLGIQSECAKMRTRITPNKETFHAVIVAVLVMI